MTVRKIEKKFDWLTEAEDYAREIFANIQAGQAYYGRIVVKKSLIGYDNENNLVRKFRNRGETLYITNRPYDATVTSTAPQMNDTF